MITITKKFGSCLRCGLEPALDMVDDQGWPIWATEDSRRPGGEGICGDLHRFPLLSEVTRDAQGSVTKVTRRLLGRGVRGVLTFERVRSKGKWTVSFRSTVPTPQAVVGTEEVILCWGEKTSPLHEGRTGSWRAVLALQESSLWEAEVRVN